MMSRGGSRIIRLRYVNILEPFSAVRIHLKCDSVPPPLILRDRRRGTRISSGRQFSLASHFAGMYLKLRRTNIPFTSFPSILSSCSLQSRASSNLNPRKSTAFAMCSSFSPVGRVGTLERFILGFCNECLFGLILRSCFSILSNKFSFLVSFRYQYRVFYLLCMFWHYR